MGWVNTAAGLIESIGIVTSDTLLKIFTVARVFPLALIIVNKTYQNGAL